LGEQIQTTPFQKFVWWVFLSENQIRTTRKAVWEMRSWRTIVMRSVGRRGFSDHPLETDPRIIGLLSAAQSASEFRLLAAQSAIKDDLQAAQSVMKNDLQAAQSVMKNDLQAAQSASELRIQAAQSVMKNDLQAAQSATKNDLQAAQSATKNDLQAAQSASELRIHAAQSAIKDDLQSAQSASELRMQATQSASELRFREVVNLNSYKLLGAMCTAFVTILAVFSSVGGVVSAPWSNRKTQLN
jgi:hypothetical protein